MAKCPINRTRNLQKGTLLFVVLCIALAVNQCGTAEEKPLFVQDPLPYPEDALENHISPPRLLACTMANIMPDM